MPRSANGTKATPLEKMLNDASWSVSRAMGLEATGLKAEAHVEWLRAAEREEEVAFYLEAEGNDLEAAVHRISAASSYEKLQQYPKAIVLLRAALSVELRTAYRATIEKQLSDCLRKAKLQMRRQRTKTRTPVR